ncbi:hypothetical protein AGMMS49546_36930 [Spirochaetia bacterium]|nr:hypothetical protein AGMMS49546_36930 [Spirochaetia bacterium]
MVHWLLLALFLGAAIPGPGSLFAAAPLQGVVAGGTDSPDSAARAARLKLIATAEKYRGTPYRYGGIDPRGLDCSGLVYLSFREALAVSVPRNAGALYSWTEKIDLEKVQPGDLVFFATLGGSNSAVSHVGIYTGDGRFIHSASEGPQTGVMYSGLDESYWHKNFVSVGRALPEASGLPSGNTALAGLNGPAGSSGGGPGPAANPAESGGERVKPSTGGDGRTNPTAGKGFWGGKNDTAGGNSGDGTGKFVAGVGIAPSWNGFLEGGAPLRGGSMQMHIAYKASVFGKSIRPGLELRPELDNTLGVFRVPLTLSLGLDDRFRIFGGPVLSVGDPVLQNGSTRRHYTGGYGAVGITVAPFSFTMGRGKLAPYGEVAWQSYFSGPGQERNWNADFGAGLRISTGIRFTVDL